MTIMTKEKLIESVKISFTIAEVLKKMNMSITTGNYKTFHRKVKEFNINTDHFLGQSHLRGKNHFTKKSKALDEILVANSNYTAISNLKKRLVNNNLLSYKCSICQISNWQGKSLSLQLDHINGINDDNRLENLRLICPNCHSQTDTFAGRNIKRSSDKFCTCGNEKLSNSNTCRECRAKSQQKITKDDLIILVKDIGITKAAKKLGVAYQTIWKKMKVYSSSS